jgi:signal peptidase
MAPLFSAGDAVIVEHPDPSRLRPGDVVTFAPSVGGKTTTHRIHQLKPRPEGLFLQTKGDANATPDPNFVPASSVTGVMTQSIPYLGFWLAYFQSPQGKVLILGTPLLLILMAQTVSMIRDVTDVRRARTEPASWTPTVTSPS